jgi:hypothetical protein
MIETGFGFGSFGDGSPVVVGGAPEFFRQPFRLASGNLDQQPDSDLRSKAVLQQYLQAKSTGIITQRTKQEPQWRLRVSLALVIHRIAKARV